MIEPPQWNALKAVAYFSMEIGLEEGMATYAGGLGILAGDVMRSAADLNLPMIGVTLVSRRGYSKQLIDEFGRQHELPDAWHPEAFAQPLGTKVVISLEGRQVWIAAWFYLVHSPRGTSVPVILLDTHLTENHVDDRCLTERLYGGDAAYRLKQEAVLGIGGVRMLRALGVSVTCYHMNEGHSALLSLESQRCGEPARRIFTTHTPVEAGHDKFPYPLWTQILGEYCPARTLMALAGSEKLNMTRLALSMADYVNGVAHRHASVSQRMFPDYKVRAITNGVHPRTWTSVSMRQVFDRHWPGWHHSPELLMGAEYISGNEVWEAHLASKRLLIQLVRDRGGPRLDLELPIIGFARRMTSYKRAGLLFQNLERLKEIAHNHPFQVILAGKAHPDDQEGKQIIQELHQHSATLVGTITVCFVPNYDIAVASAMVSGSDIWLNTPQAPQEASGTSGMKAAFNGVPNLSVLDGWWLEGCIEGVTGWAIGTGEQSTEESDALSLYHKLDKSVLPLWYGDRDGWVAVMKGAIGRNANYFNSQRMMRHYAAEAYLL